MLLLSDQFGHAGRCDHPGAVTAGPLVEVLVVGNDGQRGWCHNGAGHLVGSPGVGRGREHEVIVDLGLAGRGIIVDVGIRLLGIGAERQGQAVVGGHVSRSGAGPGGVGGPDDQMLGRHADVGRRAARRGRCGIRRECNKGHNGQGTQSGSMHDDSPLGSKDYCLCLEVKLTPKKVFPLLLRSSVL